MVHQPVDEPHQSVDNQAQLTPVGPVENSGDWTSSVTSFASASLWFEPEPWHHHQDGPTQAAKIPGSDRPRPPGGRSWSGRRASSPSTTTSGSAHPQRARSSRSASDLVGDRGALHRHQGPGGLDQRHRPVQQPAQRSDGSRRHHVEPSRPCNASARPRTTSTGSSPSSATTSSRNVVRRSSGSTSVTVQVGSSDGQHQPGQPGTGADVAHGRVGRDLAGNAARSSPGVDPTGGEPPADRSAPGGRPSVASSSA